MVAKTSCRIKRIKYKKNTAYRKRRKSGVESIRLLAEVFDIDAHILQEEILQERKRVDNKEKIATTHIHIADDEREAMEYVK